MTLRTQVVGRFFLGVSSLLSLANNPVAQAQQAPSNDPQTQSGIVLSGNSDKQAEIKTVESLLNQDKNISDEQKNKREELKKWAIENRYMQQVVDVVSNPAMYTVDEDDIGFVIGKKMILQDRETGKLEFVEDNEQNQERAAKENKQIIRRDKSSNFNLGIGKNPIIIELIKKDKELKARVDKFILEHPDEAFCIGLGLNIIDYPLTEEIQELCRKKPELQISYYFSQQNNWKVNNVDRGIVRSEETYNSKLAQGVVQNDGYVEEGLQNVPQEDKAIARKHPKHPVSATLSGLEKWILEEADMETAIDATLNGLDDLVVQGVVVKDQTSEYVENIVKKLNRPVTEKEIRLVRENLDSDLAQLAGNRFYLEGRTPEDIQTDIDLAIEDTKKKIGYFEERYDRYRREHEVSPFAEKLFSNLALPLTDDLINLLTSEPYITTSASERMAERVDFFPTEEHLQIANRDPKTSFAKGVRTNIAIKTLNEVIDKTNEIIKKVEAQENNSQEVTQLIQEIKKLIKQKDKTILTAKNQAHPARMINVYREIIEKAREELEKSLL